MGNLMTMGSCLNEQQKRWNNNVQMAHRVADSYMGYAEQNSTDAHELGVTAQLLTNFAEKHGSYDKCVRAFGRVNDSAADAFAQATHVSNFGPWLMDVFPLITAWYPEFPLKDLISVQEMEKPLAWMFFSVLKTGTNKAPTTIGELVETPLGMRQLKAKYVTGEIFGENIVGGAASGGTAVSDNSQIVYLGRRGNKGRCQYQGCERTFSIRTNQSRRRGLQEKTNVDNHHWWNGDKLHLRQRKQRCDFVLR